LSGGNTRTYPVRVQKILRPPLPPLEYNTDAEAALRRMDKDKVAWLPVVKGGQIVGPVSRWDIFSGLAALPLDTSSMAVGGLISKSATCSRLEDTVSSSAAKGNGRDILRVLLIDGENRLVAITFVGRPESLGRNRDKRTGCGDTIGRHSEELLLGR
jgi:hypothetical protein